MWGWIDSITCAVAAKEGSRRRWMTMTAAQLGRRSRRAEGVKRR